MNALDNKSAYDFWNSDLQDIEQEIFGKNAADAEQFAIDDRVPISGSVMAKKLISVNSIPSQPTILRDLWLWFKGSDR